MGRWDSNTEFSAKYRNRIPAQPGHARGESPPLVKISNDHTPLQEPGTQGPFSAISPPSPTISVSLSLYPPAAAITTQPATTNQPYPLPAARPAPLHTNSPLGIPRRNAATTLGPVAKHWFSSHHQLDTVQNKDKRCTIRNGVGISSSIVDCNPFILPYLSLSLFLLLSITRDGVIGLYSNNFSISVDPN